MDWWSRSCYRCCHHLCWPRSSLSGFWRSNNYDWYLHDNLFYLGWNPRWFYVEKINVKEYSEGLMKTGRFLIVYLTSFNLLLTSFNLLGLNDLASCHPIHVSRYNKILNRICK